MTESGIYIHAKSHFLEDESLRLLNSDLGFVKYEFL